MIVIVDKLKKKYYKVVQDKHLYELLMGSAVAFVLKIVGILGGYIFTLLVARFYGASTMGIFALSLTILQIITVLGRLGMDTALLRLVAEFKSKNNFYAIWKIYQVVILYVLIFSAFLTLSLYFFAPIIAKFFFEKPYLKEYFQIISFAILPVAMLYIHTEAIRGLKEIKTYMLLQQTSIFFIASLFLYFIIFFDIKTYNPEASKIPIWVYVISIIIVSIVALLIWIKKIYPKTHENLPILRSLLTKRELFHIAIPMLLSSSLGFIMTWTDTIMLGVFRTEEEVGIYNVVFKVSMITSLSLMSINTIAAPKFAEFWSKGNINKLTEIAQKSTRLIFWTSFPFLTLLLLIPCEILAIFGDKFKAGATALIILAIGQFVNSTAGSVGYLLQMTGHQHLHRNVILIGTFINIFINWLLIPKYGMLGAALASTTSLIFWNLTFVFYVYKKLKIDIYNLTSRRNV